MRDFGSTSTIRVNGDTQTTTKTRYFPKLLANLRWHCGAAIGIKRPVQKKHLFSQQRVNETDFLVASNE